MLIVHCKLYIVNCLYLVSFTLQHGCAILREPRSSFRWCISCLWLVLVIAPLLRRQLCGWKPHLLYSTKWLRSFVVTPIFCMLCITCLWHVPVIVPLLRRQYPSTLSTLSTPSTLSTLSTPHLHWALRRAPLHRVASPTAALIDCNEKNPAAGNTTIITLCRNSLCR